EEDFILQALRKAYLGLANAPPILDIPLLFSYNLKEAARVNNGALELNRLLLNTASLNAKQIPALVRALSREILSHELKHLSGIQEKQIKKESLEYFINNPRLLKALLYIDEHKINGIRLNSAWKQEIKERFPFIPDAIDIEIVKLLEKSESNSEIANDTGITQRQVEDRLRILYKEFSIDASRWLKARESLVRKFVEIELLPEGVLNILSIQELQLIRLIAQKKTNEEIAKTLYMSRRRVADAINVLFHKLNLEGDVNRIKIVKEALGRGYLTQFDVSIYNIDPEVNPLNASEIKILNLAAQEKSDKEISRITGLAHQTISYGWHRIYAKLDIKNGNSPRRRARAIKRAIKKKYISSTLSTAQLEHKTKAYITPREIEILKLLQLGFLPEEIAKCLHITQNEVHHRLADIYNKLDVPKSKLRYLAAVNAAMELAYLPDKTYGELPVSLKNPFTKGEYQVLELMAQGKTYEEIQNILGVSRGTFNRYYLLNIRKKLNIPEVIDPDEIVLKAIEEGFLPQLKSLQEHSLSREEYNLLNSLSEGSDVSKSNKSEQLIGSILIKLGVTNLKDALLLFRTYNGLLLKKMNGEYREEAENDNGIEPNFWNNRIQKGKFPDNLKLIGIFLLLGLGAAGLVLSSLPAAELLTGLKSILPSVAGGELVFCGQAGVAGGEQAFTGLAGALSFAALFVSRISIGGREYRINWEIDLGDGTKLLVLSAKDNPMLRVDGKNNKVIVGNQKDLLEKLASVLPDIRDFRLLEALINHNDPFIRSTAISNLPQDCPEEVKAILLKKSNSLFRDGAIGGDINPHVRRDLAVAIDNLISRQDSIDTRFIKPIRKLVEDNASSVRQRAMLVSAKLQDREFIVPRIIGFLRRDGENYSWDREFAARSAQYIKDERLIGPLKKCLMNQKEISKVKQHMALALGFQYQGNSEIEDLLVWLAQAGNPSEREHAVIALSMVATPRAIGVIERIAKSDSNPYTKNKAEQVLKVLTLDKPAEGMPAVLYCCLIPVDPLLFKRAFIYIRNNVKRIRLIPSLFNTAQTHRIIKGYNEFQRIIFSLNKKALSHKKEIIVVLALLGLGLTGLLYLPWLVGSELLYFGFAGALSFGLVIYNGDSSDKEAWQEDYYRLSRKLLEGKQKELFDKVDAFYRGLDIEAFRNKIKQIAEKLNDAPFVYELYGLGYPFYGNVDIRKRTYLLLQELDSRNIDTDEFMSRLIPDIDLMLIHSPSEEGPWSVQSANKSIIMYNFITEVSLFEAEWKKIFDKLTNEFHLTRGRLESGYMDPIGQFLQEGRLHVDLNPVPTHIWRNIPVFVLEQDINLLWFMRDLLFTCELLSRKETNLPQNIPLEFRRNYILNLLKQNTLTIEELLTKVIELHTYRDLIELFEQTKDIVKKWVTEAVKSALAEGLIYQEKERLVLSKSGTAFLDSVLEKRKRIIEEGFSIRDPIFAKNNYHAGTEENTKESNNPKAQIDYEYLSKLYKEGIANIAKQSEAGADEEIIARDISLLTDDVVIELIKLVELELVNDLGSASSSYVLIATGSFGSREMHLGSDVDINLVYSQESENEKGINSREYFTEFTRRMEERATGIGLKPHFDNLDFFSITGRTIEKWISVVELDSLAIRKEMLTARYLYADKSVFDKFLQGIKPLYDKAFLKRLKDIILIDPNIRASSKIPDLQRECLNLHNILSMVTAYLQVKFNIFAGQGGIATLKLMQEKGYIKPHIVRVLLNTYKTYLKLCNELSYNPNSAGLEDRFKACLQSVKGVATELLS
ncbi:MAG: LuxR C-terminal-related transcriptional regulator, partial [Candidatus Omnitrophica bacterium]|nr:LuxR C-terminal-related transcriptional regulator [Candidatus Omnitrophota bacterium]